MMVICLIVLLLFGAKKLPELAGGWSSGKGVQRSRDEMEKGITQSRPQRSKAQVKLPDAKSDRLSPELVRRPNSNCCSDHRLATERKSMIDPEPIIAQKAIVILRRGFGGVYAHSS